MVADSIGETPLASKCVWIHSGEWVTQRQRRMIDQTMKMTGAVTHANRDFRNVTIGKMKRLKG